jgi:hypothetical protein
MKDSPHVNLHSLLRHDAWSSKLLLERAPPGSYQRPIKAVKTSMLPWAGRSVEGGPREVVFSPAPARKRICMGAGLRPYEIGHYFR